MARRRVLVQWIGHSDLRALAADLPAKRQQEVLGVVRGAVQPGDQGPTRTLSETLDLLWHFPAAF